MNNLKQCPFCHSEKIAIGSKYNKKIYCVFCPKCGIGIKPMGQKQRVIALWNKTAERLYPIFACTPKEHKEEK